MFVSQIALTNFKCFREAKLPLRKITLLLGANSSGKSSLLAGMLSALQSQQFPLLYSPNGDYVTLGDFKALAHQHRLGVQTGLRFTIDGHHNGPIELGGEYELSPEDRLPTLIGASFTQKCFQLRITKDVKYHANWQYDPEQDSLAKAGTSEEIRALFLAVARISAQSRPRKKPTPVEPADSADLGSTLAPPPREGSFSFGSPRSFLTAAKPDRHFYLGQNFATATNVMNELTSRFNYIGAFRHEPVRTYYQVRLANLKLGRSGENYVHQIADWQSRHSVEERRLQQHLRKLGLVRELRAHALGGGRLELQVRTVRKGAKASVVDVGFGLSQLLPILVADLQLPRGSTLALSQPEIHLHPSVQADLGEYFVDRARLDDKRYIVETHSEYLFNRLRYLVADGKLKEEDLSVLYLENNGSTSTLYPIRFRTDGAIEGAPKGFFETYMLDVMNLALKASE